MTRSVIFQIRHDEDEDRTYQVTVQPDVDPAAAMVGFYRAVRATDPPVAAWCNVADATWSDVLHTLAGLTRDNSPQLAQLSADQGILSVWSLYPDWEFRSDDRIEEDEDEVDE
jgi:hypothetical protein